MRRCASAVIALVVALPVGQAAATTRAAGSTVDQRGGKRLQAVRRPVPRFVFRFPGRGNGHGVGMSQYGALGAARAGMTAEQILAMYYPGTTIGALPPAPVRVQLAASVPSLEVSCDAVWVIRSDGASPAEQALPTATVLRVTQAAGTIMVTDPGGAVVARRPAPVVFSPSVPGGSVALGSVRYRGTLRVVAAGAGLGIVNTVGLEDYLQGVVALEMPASWGDTAPSVLEAQAIAARSYAMATRRSGDFDVYADERSQMYGGASAEDARTNRAVQATAGRIVTYQGAVATTFFFSTSGGRTENAENVFGNPVPYLVSVDDARFDRLSPRFVWRGPDVPTFSDARLGRLLGTKTVLSVRIVKRGVSPRVVQLRITTRSGGVKLMSGAEVRRALGLASTWFSVVRAVRR